MCVHATTAHSSRSCSCIGNKLQSKKQRNNRGVNMSIFGAQLNGNSPFVSFTSEGLTYKMGSDSVCMIRLACLVCNQCPEKVRVYRHFFMRLNYWAYIAYVFFFSCFPLLSFRSFCYQLNNRLTKTKLLNDFKWNKAFHIYD